MRIIYSEHAGSDEEEEWEWEKGLDEPNTTLPCGGYKLNFVPSTRKVYKVGMSNDAAFRPMLTTTTAHVLLCYLITQGLASQVTCLAFRDIVNQLAYLPKTQPVTATDLLKPQTFHEIQFLTEKKLITFFLKEKLEAAC